MLCRKLPAHCLSFSWQQRSGVTVIHSKVSSSKLLSLVVSQHTVVWLVATDHRAVPVIAGFKHYTHTPHSVEIKWWRNHIVDIDSSNQILHNCWNNYATKNKNFAGYKHDCCLKTISDWPLTSSQDVAIIEVTEKLQRSYREATEKSTEQNSSCLFS